MVMLLQECRHHTQQQEQQQLGLRGWIYQQQQ